MALKSYARRMLRACGPGFIAGAADDDPTAVATYTQTGALFGYAQLWTQPYALPFMIAVQEMCGRIGLVTGRGLSGVIRKYYSRRLLYIAVSLLLIANIVNIGANLGAMAAAVQLIVPISYVPALIGVAILPLMIELIIPYARYARFLKFLALFLIAYIATALIVETNWSAHVFAVALTPHIVFSKEYLLNIAAILGTTISPYLFFWQSDEEVEEEIAHHKIRAMGRGTPRIGSADLRALRWDTTLGMIFSQIITFFIIITAAATLGASGLTSISSTAEAVLALKPLAGDFASLLFALGLLGTGLLAVPVLAGSAAYALSEALNWKVGLGRTFRQAPAFHVVIAIATLAGLGINAIPISPITMLYYAAALNAVLAPPLLVMILIIANNRTIMGSRVNGPTANLFGSLITIIMGIVSFAILASIAIA